MLDNKPGEEQKGAEFMSDKAIQRLLDYLKNVKCWTDKKVLELIKHLAEKSRAVLTPSSVCILNQKSGKVNRFL